MVKPHSIVPNSEIKHKNYFNIIASIGLIFVLVIKKSNFEPVLFFIIIIYFMVKVKEAALR